MFHVAFRRNVALLFITLIVTTLLEASFVIPELQAQSNPSAWFDPSWFMRRPVTIVNTLNSNDLSGYQVRIEVGYDSDMRSDFSDLRFTRDDQVTPIPYWVEEYTLSTSAVVWIRVPSIPASNTTNIYMYYGNSTAPSASNGTATFEFFDDFSGSTLDPNKWTINAVGNIVHTVNDHFRFEDPLKSGDLYWIQDGTDTGSQHQANWAPLSQFTVEFESRVSDVTAPERGEGFLGLVATDDTVIGAAGHQDWQGSLVQATRGVVTENTASSVGDGVIQWGSSMSYKHVSNTDAIDWKMINNGSTLKFYDGSGFFAEASFSSSISKLALMAGAYEPYVYLDYVQMTDIRVRKFASPEPSISIGSEEDYRMKGRIAWWDLAWFYRKPINVTERSGSSLVNYQVQLVIDHVAAKMNPDFSDLRFADRDQVTLIPYWVEKYTTAVSAVVWVNVPRIPASGNTTIYMYYGNPAATSASNGPATFEFFDDFETAYEGPSLWTEKQSIPIPRSDSTAAVYNGKIYVFGGFYQNTGDVRRDTYEYDPLSDFWTRKADMPTARWGPIAIEYDGLIYVFGGTVNVNEVYDPATDTWTARNALPAGFNQGLMAATYGDKIHLFYVGMHYEYDPATDTYTQKASMPTSRSWAACAVVGDKIYLIAGHNSVYGALNVNEAYDPATNTWATMAPMPLSKYGGARESSVINGRIYVPFGRNGTGETGDFYVNNFVYDPSTDSWLQKSPAVHARAGPCGGVVDDKLYVVGGRGLPVLGLGYNEEYDPSTDTWIESPWTFSDPVKVGRDVSAKYEGSYGLLVYEDVGLSPQYAERSQNFSTFAVDLYWDVTDAFGIDPNQPQGRILFADRANPGYGSLCYYNNSGASFSWFEDGGYTPLQEGSWNAWYSATIIWNGLDSKVIINGTEHAVSATQINSDRLYFGVSEQTEMFIDLVRIRKYSSPTPLATFGAEEEPAYIKSCDSDGTELESFIEGATLYVKGGSLKANTEYKLFVANDVSAWNDGDPIPARVPDTADSVFSDSSGSIQPVAVWSSVLPGSYDIVLDVLENGVYNSVFDALGGFDVSLPAYDIAVMTVSPSKTVVDCGYPMFINVTVANQGNVPAEFNVTVYGNSTGIATANVTLANGAVSTVSVVWNTTGFAFGNYTMNAYVHPLPGETDTADNSQNDGAVVVTIVGDVNGDGVVNVLDLTIVALSYGFFKAEPDYNPEADINDDGVVDMRDLVLISRRL